MKIKKLEGQVNDLKKHSINCLLSYIHTIRQMDQHSKKMMFKRFEAQAVNSFSRTAPIVEKKMDEIAQDTLLNHKVDLESDQIESDTSGNDSENDEIGHISKVRSRLIEEKAAVSDSSSDNSLDALQDDINQQDAADRLGTLRIEKSATKLGYGRSIRNKANSSTVSKAKVSQHVDRHKELLSKSKLYATDRKYSVGSSNDYPPIQSSN